MNQNPWDKAAEEVAQKAKRKERNWVAWCERQGGTSAGWGYFEKQKWSRPQFRAALKAMPSTVDDETYHRYVIGARHASQRFLIDDGWQENLSLVGGVLLTFVLGVALFVSAAGGIATGDPTALYVFVPSAAWYGYWGWRVYRHYKDLGE